MNKENELELILKIKCKKTYLYISHHITLVFYSEIQPLNYIHKKIIYKLSILISNIVIII